MTSRISAFSVGDALNRNKHSARGIRLSELMRLKQKNKHWPCAYFTGFVPTGARISYPSVPIAFSRQLQ